MIGKDAVRSERVSFHTLLLEGGGGRVGGHMYVQGKGALRSGRVLFTIVKLLGMVGS